MASLYSDDQFLSSSGFGKRHELIVLLFFGFAGLYAMRVNLSVAIVAMVMLRPLSRTEKLNLEDTCPLPAEIEKKSSSVQYVSLKSFLTFVLLHSFILSWCYIP